MRLLMMCAVESLLLGSFHSQIPVWALPCIQNLLILYRYGNLWMVLYVCTGFDCECMLFVLNNAITLTHPTFAPQSVSCGNNANLIILIFFDIAWLKWSCELKRMEEKRCDMETKEHFIAWEGGLKLPVAADWQIDSAANICICSEVVRGIFPATCTFRKALN